MSGVVAAIDCGTNTIKLLVAGPERSLVRTAHVVRLGEGVDRTGRLADAALARTLAVVEEYAALVTAHGAERVRFCATSATRDATNAAVFAEGVRRRLGVEPEVLTGAEEAALSFGGAVGSLADRADGGLAEPVMVVDVGGGSTELVLGRSGVDGGAPVVEQACSMDVGSVRLHERHDLSDPPTAAQVSAVRADLDAALAACPVEAARAATVVGVSGTVTSLATGLLGVTAESLESVPAVHGRRLDVADLGALVDDLLAMTVAQRLALGWLQEGRADVVGVGALVLMRVLEHAGATSLVVSDHDLLDGIAQSLW